MKMASYYRQLESSLLSYAVNETSANYTSQSDSNNTNHAIHLFILTSVWVVLLITIICGTIGNILVLYVYISRKDNKTSTFFIKMLAIVDLIVCLILAPLELYYITTGIRNEFLCKFYGFLSTHVLYSTLLITTIAFDRYFCICWPLYKIITTRRAHAIVIICGILSSVLAIVPMMEYSTKEHVFQVHRNHSEHLSIESSDRNNAPTYTHVEHIKKSDLSVLFMVRNTTDVSCSPKSNLHLESSTYFYAYRKFHGALFAVCLLLVLILYAFIYNAVYERRVTRTRKLSAYRRIIHSHLMNNETGTRATQTSKNVHDHHRHYHSHHEHTPSILALICCYCCEINDQYSRELRRTSKSALQETSHRRRRQLDHVHLNDEALSVIDNTNGLKPQIVLEVNSAHGKRYSAMSTTSVSYLTSGTWDETTSANLVRSRINSTAAITYCGAEHSSTSRPSSSTEDSFEQIEQTTKLLTPNNTLQLRSMTPSNSTYLTVPRQQITAATTTLTLSSSSGDVVIKDNQLNDDELLSIPQCTNLRHSSVAHRSSNALSIRQSQRSSDASVQQRKVSFRVADQSIGEDSANTFQRSSLESSSSPISLKQPQRNQINIYKSSSRSLSTVSSINHTTNSPTRDVSISLSSPRRPSTFDSEAQRIIERQQAQECLANIRTTLILFIVTATFILMYLPSLIYTLFRIGPHDFREVLSILYYINSACNPLIYSFFNVNFRNDIRRIYECQKREYLARQY